jgi:hypothetical protein
MTSTTQEKQAGCERGRSLFQLQKIRMGEQNQRWSSIYRLLLSGGDRRGPGRSVLILAVSATKRWIYQRHQGLMRQPKGFARQSSSPSHQKAACVAEE